MTSVKDKFNNYLIENLNRKISDDDKKILMKFKTLIEKLDDEDFQSFKEKNKSIFSKFENNIYFGSKKEESIQKIETYKIINPKKEKYDIYSSFRNNIIPKLFENDNWYLKYDEKENNFIVASNSKPTLNEDLQILEKKGDSYYKLNIANKYVTIYFNKSTDNILPFLVKSFCKDRCKIVNLDDSKFWFEQVFDGVQNHGYSDFIKVNQNLNYLGVENQKMVNLNIPDFDEKTLKNPDYEIEARFKNISERQWYRLLGNLKSQYKESEVLSKEYLFENVKMVILNDETTYQSKINISSYHLNLGMNGVKISVSEEKNLPKTTFFNKEKALVRDKKRHSFEIILNKVRADLTIVNGKDYEVEIELIKSDSFTSSSFSDDVKESNSTFKQGLLLIFQHLYNSSIFFEKEEYENVTSFLMGNNKNIHHLIPKKPKNIIPKQIVSGLKNYYYSVKADGYTRFLVIYNNRIYTLFPSDDFESYGLIANEHTKLNFPNSIFLMELIPGEKRLDDKTVPNYFLVFDEMIKNEKNYITRYNSATNKINKLNSILDKSIFKIEMKPIFPLDNMTKFYNFYKNIDNLGLLYSNDGVILTPMLEDEIFKIKPFEKLTIDFLIDYETKTLNITDKGKIREFVGSDFPIKIPFDSEFNVDWNSIPEGIKIGEFRPIKNKDNIIFVFEKNRSFDKTTPNSNITASSIWTEINSEKEIIEYFNEDDNTFRLRNYHNMIKKHIFDDIKDKQNSLIIDIGSGKGGDLSRFKDFSSILLVEPNENNLKELKTRLAAYNFKKCTVLNIGGEDYVQIVDEAKKLIDKKITKIYISFMLSLTFFFEKSMYDKLLRTLNSILSINSNQTIEFKVIFFVMTNVENINSKPFQLEIRKEKGKQTLIYININDSIVEEQIEYEVDMEKLIKDIKGKHFKMINAEEFRKDDIYLSQLEKKINKLYSFGSFSIDVTKARLSPSIEKESKVNPTEVKSMLKFVRHRNIEKLDFKDLDKELKPSKIDLSKKINIILEDLEKNQVFKSKFYNFNSDPYDKKFFIKVLNDNKKVIPKVFTKAWLKMHEIIDIFDLKKTLSSQIKSDKLKVFCNAELPGSFISALIYNFGKDNLDWRASSLFEGENYLEDIYNMYADNKERWIMNKETMNGDVTKFENITFIENYFNLFGKVDLYTSDVGVGVSENFEKEEEKNLKVNLGQISCGLLTLKEDKKSVFIIKTYSFDLKISRELIRILNESFNHLTFCKPNTSKCLNKEIYIVCVGYKGLKNKDKFKAYVKEILESDLDSKSKYFIRNDKTFDSMIINAGNIFKENLLEALNKFALTVKDNLSNQNYKNIFENSCIENNINLWLFSSNRIIKENLDSKLSDQKDVFTFDENNIYKNKEFFGNILVSKESNPESGSEFLKLTLNLDIKNNLVILTDLIIPHMKVTFYNYDYFIVKTDDKSLGELLKSVGFSFENEDIFKYNIKVEEKSKGKIVRKRK